MSNIMSKPDNTLSNKRKTLYSILRAAHRDIGYFVTGITLVYALSGIFLSHKGLFPATKAITVEMALPIGVDTSVFEDYWDKYLPDKKLIRYAEKDEKIDFYIEGGKGFYIKKTGKLNYEYYQQNKFILKLNQLHANRIKGWRHIADLFAVTLLFLAISGLVIVRGKNGFRKRGVWLMLSGVILIVVFLIL